MVIWKDQIGTHGRYDAEWPDGSEIVMVAGQGDYVTFWYECDPEAEYTTRKFQVCWTGEPAPEGGKHIGTAMVQYLVCHVYEVF